jgi:16S rRNA (guanine527-N7)-methyltransferase
MPRAESPPAAADVARRLRRAGVDLGDSQSDALARFLDLLIRWNRVYNLTGIRDPDELVDRHLLESLALRPLLRGDRVADVGTGAGLPGLPLAIVEPERSFTLIESRAKRVRFLRQVIADLGLRNASVAHGRAEHLRPERPFATVLARAVAPPAELLAIARSLTAPGSFLVLLTAAHLETQFAGLAPDFVPRTVELARGAPKLKSSIVVLERVDVQTER